MRRGRFLNLVVMGFMFLALGSFAKVSFADPDALVASGKTELFTNKNLLAANDDFSAAVGEVPTHPQANFWYGLTRIEVLTQSQATLDLLTASGFTKLDDSPLDIAALDPFNPDIKPPATLPTNSPTATEVQDFFKDTILAEIDASLSDNFGAIDEGTFTDTVDFGDGVKELDGGEVLACRAALNFFSAWLHSFCVYNFNSLDIDALAAEFEPEPNTFSINDDLLGAYADLLTPLAAAGTQLAAGKSALEAMINSTLDAIDFIEAETDDQSDDLITIGPEDAEDVEEAEDFLNLILSTLSGPEDITLTPPFEGNELPIQIRLDLFEFFDDTDPINLRSKLPTFTADNEVVRSSFPDPTMGGVTPKTTQADLNHLSGIGPELYDPKVIWASPPSVELTWEQELNPDFDYYRIYRTTPQAPTTWVQIGNDMTNPADTTLTDDTVDESTSRIYYYRLHTYYTSVTDSTYSDAELAVLTLYVDVNSASADEDGSKTKPFKDLGDAIDDYATNGTKVCVAAGRYNESDVTLHMWSLDGLVLEGGYESTGWTRDIQTNETIIDATGLWGWNVVSFNEVNGGTVDGFTITGGHLNDWSSAVSLHRASNITVKDCKLIDNQRGVGVGEDSDCLVQNCYIAQNTRDGIGMWNSGSAVVRDCIITGNQRGIGVWQDSSAVIRDCAIFGNSDKGIQVYNSPNNAYSVYGGDTYLSGQDGYHPQDFGYTFLGSDRITRTYYGTYDYYIIVTDAANPVKVDTVQGSDTTYYATFTTGNTQDWGNVGGAPDGAFATVGTEDTGGYILIDPTSGNSSLKVYIVDEPSLGQVEIRDSIIENNSNGGIDFGYTSGTIKNNLIVDNAGGTGIFCDRAGTVSIENNTIAGNGGNGGIQCQINSNPTIKNNIIVSNNYGIYCDATSSPDISYNDVYGNNGGNYSNCSAGTGDISQDPLFVDGPNGPYYLSQEASYQSEDSLCLNAGSATAASLGFGASYTTRTDCQADADIVDMGYHYPEEITGVSPLVLNEFLPNPTGNDSGNEWVELYNRSPWPIDISGYVIDDLIGGGESPQRVPVGTIIRGYSFYAMNLPDTYLNNDGDTVNLLWPDNETIIDSNIYASTTEGGSHYRCPDGCGWSKQLDFTPTKNSMNCLIPPFLTADLNTTSQDDVIIDFGPDYGIWIMYDNDRPNWWKLHSLSPDSMVRADLNADGRDELVIDFGKPYGIWRYYPQTGIWNKLHSLSCEFMVSADLDGTGRDELVIDFGNPYGIYVWHNDSSWKKLHALSPDFMVKGNIDADAEGKDDLVIDFGDPYGIYIWYNNSSWSKLHALSPEKMITADINNDGKDEIVIDFGEPYDIWRFYPQTTTWSKLHTLNCESMVAGDLDADPKDDLVIDFGTSYGIYKWHNNSSWKKLHGLSPDLMIAGDMDDTGRDELIIDFGNPYGIYIWYNNSNWVKLHYLSP